MGDVAEQSVGNEKVTFSSDAARQGRQTTGAAKRRGKTAGIATGQNHMQYLVQIF
jgi:hypothetical protein